MSIKQLLCMFEVLSSKACVPQEQITIRRSQIARRVRNEDQDPSNLSIHPSILVTDKTSNQYHTCNSG
jgi:hypothetical protein